ncbi:hypothetical protein SDC9_104335 [bioreactor metagenome]|uniref:Uncharacterized protein n=1 Tax=bioreactor metagenome TaxID=1076179 RepID=A0A645B2X5_9ZZZZ
MFCRAVSLCLSIDLIPALQDDAVFQPGMVKNILDPSHGNIADPRDLQKAFRYLVQQPRRQFTLVGYAHLPLQPGSDRSRYNGGHKEKQQQHHIDGPVYQQGIPRLSKEEVKQDHADDRGGNAVNISVGQYRRKEDTKQEHHDDALAAHAQA